MANGKDEPNDALLRLLLGDKTLKQWKRAPKIVWIWGLRLRMPWWWPTPISNWKQRRAIRGQQAAMDRMKNCQHTGEVLSTLRGGLSGDPEDGNRVICAECGETL